MQHRFNFFATRRRQCGQTYAEYLVVTIALASLVLASNDYPGIAALIDALKSFFGAYSFTLSLP